MHTRTLIAFLCCGLGANPAAADGEDDPARARAQRLGRRAAVEFTGPDAVPFVSPAQQRADARKAFPAATIESMDVRIDGVALTTWLVSPVRGADNRGLVVVLPGWQSHAGLALERTSFLLQAGYQLYIVEDRANAFAEVDRPEDHTGFIREDVRDVAAALNQLRSARDLGSTRVALYGFSWGGLKALLLGAERSDVDAVLVDAAPRTPLVLPRLRFEEYMPPEKRQDRELYDVFVRAFDEEVERRLGYRPSEIDVAAAVVAISPRPLFIAHGRDDDFVPFSHGEWLAQRAQVPKTFLEGDRFGHCMGMTRSPDIYQPAVLSFLDRALRSKAAL
jgi:pimeloyl-ACP methyl ester carboxylesterase